MIQPIFILFLGLFIGSFLSVLIFRFPDISSIVFGRSKCVKCQKQILWYDLIPVVSYLFLRGRCRNCKKEISLIYPFLELLTAGIFFLFALKIGINLMLIPYLLFAIILISISIYDFIDLEIPEIFLCLLVLVSILIVSLSGNIGKDAIFGGLIAGGFLGLLVFFSKERLMGSGDIPIGLAFGLILGLEKTLLFLLLAFNIGAVYGVILIAAKNKKLKSEVPFAPFLIIGGLVAFLFGDHLINLYLNLLLI